jgi:mRNA interferase HicA
MTYNEFRRVLLALGARMHEGKKHTKVYLNGRQSTLPRHGTNEMSEGLRLAILKQLDVGRKD